MPTPARAVAACNPQIKGVYGREAFSMIPFPESVASNLELRSMGSGYPFAMDPSRSARSGFRHGARSVIASDFLNLPAVPPAVTVANSKHGLDFGQKRRRR